VEIERIVRAGSDRQSQAVLRDIESNAAFAQGRLDNAHDGSLETAAMMAWLAPTSFLTAARCALWSGDADRAKSALARLEATTHGPAISAGRAEIAAGLLALAGETSAAVTNYREVLETWRGLGLVWDEALTAIDMATLIGPGEPDAIAAAQVAAETLARLRAAPFLDRLSTAMGWRTAPHTGSGDVPVQPELGQPPMAGAERASQG
jgi:hypothetical protein